MKDLLGFVCLGSFTVPLIALAVFALYAGPRVILEELEVDLKNYNEWFVLSLIIYAVLSYLIGYLFYG